MSTDDAEVHEDAQPAQTIDMTKEPEIDSDDRGWESYEPVTPKIATTASEMPDLNLNSIASGDDYQDMPELNASDDEADPNAVDSKETETSPLNDPEVKYPPKICGVRCRG